MNICFVIQPDWPSWPSAHPGGPVINQCSWVLFCGNTMKGGIWFPRALIAEHTVTRMPLSWETPEPTCLSPFFANCFWGLWVVVSPVSSTFHYWLWAESFFNNFSHPFKRLLVFLCLDLCVVRESAWPNLSSLFHFVSKNLAFFRSCLQLQGHVLVFGDHQLLYHELSSFGWPLIIVHHLGKQNKKQLAVFIKHEYPAIFNKEKGIKCSFLKLRSLGQKSWSQMKALFPRTMYKIWKPHP